MEPDLDTRLQARLEELAEGYRPDRRGADVVPEVRDRASQRGLRRRSGRRLLASAAVGLMLAGVVAATVTLLGRWSQDSSGEVRTEDRADGTEAVSPPGTGSLADPTEVPAEAVDISDIPAPPLDARSNAAMVWTGEELVIWGGEPDPENTANTGSEETTYIDGAAYDPVAREWRMLPESPLAGGRELQSRGPQAVWTGAEVLVIEAGQAAAWDPGTNLWREVAAPPGEGLLGLVATGTEVIQFDPGAGAVWDPDADEWTQLPEPPEHLPYGDAVWTGDEVVVVGTASLGWPDETTRGMAYDPAAAEWRTLPSTDAARAVAATWTGEEVLVTGYDSDRNTAAYDPVADEWRSLGEVPMTQNEALPSVHMIGETPVISSYPGTAVLIDDQWYPLAGEGGGDRDVVSGAGAIWSLGFDIESPAGATLSAFRPPTSTSEMSGSVLNIAYYDVRVPDGFVPGQIEISDSAYAGRIAAELSAPGGPCEVKWSAGAPAEGEEFMVDPVDGRPFEAVRIEPGHIQLSDGRDTLTMGDTTLTNFLEVVCETPDDAETLVRHISPPAL